MGKCKSKTQMTHKKQKLIGTSEVVDRTTGEVIPVQITKLEDRDFNFHKVWLQNMITSLGDITNKRMELAFWIIDNLNKENQLVMTQRKIAELTGISLRTVTDTMKILQSGKIPFLKKINSGAYQVNPAVIWKGSYASRMGIILDYSEEEETEFEEDYNEETVENKDNETNTD